ncbi:hypothetical protein [Streptomyces lavendulae]|uniref:hypothetical protein n=1 Tax=Streptomyces lavendulae TaxID=1914 RepID=UPI0024A2299A|nr:hypothetical protein [Streptomyces lavendulae]GLW04815.1 hypothetical protein Slala05_84450 [Streptomyces lavendulae subsp. lavendulae]
MPEVKVSFKSNVGSSASFEGTVEPNGATGYKFSGTLTAYCALTREAPFTPFKNTVRLGHGGTSDDYTYLESTIGSFGQNTYTVKGEGTRTKNDKINFRVGVNDGINGEFYYGDTNTVPTGGPPQRLTLTYISKNSAGNIQYDVRFDGTARSDGPTGYVIQGGLNAYSVPGALSTQYAALGYKNSTGSWQYKTYAADETPQDITIRGQRKSGENIQAVVGATSQILNLYAYGDTIDCILPEEF